LGLLGLWPDHHGMHPQSHTQPPLIIPTQSQAESLIVSGRFLQGITAGQGPEQRGMHPHPPIRLTCSPALACTALASCAPWLSSFFPASCAASPFARIHKSVACTRPPLPHPHSTAHPTLTCTHSLPSSQLLTQHLLHFNPRFLCGITVGQGPEERRTHPYSPTHQLMCSTPHSTYNRSHPCCSGQSPQLLAWHGIV
jgi:hypothetical protein